MKIKIPRVKPKQVIKVDGFSLFFSAQSAKTFNIWATEIERRTADAKNWDDLKASERLLGPKSVLWKPITLWYSERVTKSRYTQIGAHYLAHHLGYIPSV